MPEFHLLTETLMTAVVLLFPIYNPIGTGLVLNPYFANLTDAERFVVTTKVAIYTLGLSLFFLFFGTFILDIFGVSVNVVRVAGGLFICKIAWDLLNPSPTSNNTPSNVNAQNINSYIFTPFTFPFTMAGGAISVLITLGVHNFSAHRLSTDIFVITGNVLGLLISAVIIFLVYYNSAKIVKKMGKSGGLIVNKICAFFVFCVGLNITIVGIKGVIATS